MRIAVASFLVLVFVMTFCAGICFAEQTDEAVDDSASDEDLQKKIEELEKRIDAMEESEARAKRHVESLDWENDRDYFLLPNGWSLSIHGEFRTRAIVEANTVNGYTNYAGERIYAYNPRSTFSNDYGWWDYRFKLRTVANFGETADLISLIQIGNSAWGSRAPMFGYDGQGKFDRVAIQFRELWVRAQLGPIPLYLDFGRMPWGIGNRLIVGNEHDGARIYFRHKYFELGIGSFREYEGENYEMIMATNDDEDQFLAWLDITPTTDHTVSFFGWLDDMKVTAKPNQIDPYSPLWLLPYFDQDLYEGQESQMWDVGVNYVGQVKDVTINIEYDHQFGTLNANSEAGAEDIDFKGFGGIAKIDWEIAGSETIMLIAGYGSGDDPGTVDYEGFFAHENDFGIKEDDIYEYRDRGYFAVYEYISPGAGVPGMLRENLGTGGIENTIFANLGWDSNFQANHHYWVSVGYIESARENPITNSDMIGVEMDLRIDYLFSNNLIFSIYGGHLFILGDYFREDAHDAAQFVAEWKLQW